MRVFMLGWEFPPFISGGLGTACYGLTKALSRQHVDVTFVLPKTVGSEFSSHVRLLSPQAPEAAQGDRAPRSVASRYQYKHNAKYKNEVTTNGAKAFSNVTFMAVPSKLVSPYQSTGGSVRSASPGDPGGRGAGGADQPISVLTGGPGQDAGVAGTGTHHGGQGGDGTHYGGDLFAETRRYADLCVHLAEGVDFDVIHAHDWMTFPAGLAVAAATGKPLVVHVHSTEFDRAGENVHQQVYDIERRGVHGAMRVVAVSYLTRSILLHRYGVPGDKVDVVYNGIDNADNQDQKAALPRTAITRGDKIVLFLGRITMQKGPEYFITAAKKVLEKFDKVKFVVAGSGDKVRDVIELAAAHGIGHKVLFTGFLRGRDVERVFQMADVYVMPSVSEPFGIAPLEAIRHDVPVIISKTSGVAEVLTHALKVDFWDTDEIANKVIAVLRHPPLSTTLREHADIEVRNLTWDGAASRCSQVYQQTAEMMAV